MVTAFDNRFRPLAHKLISKYGKDVVFTKTTAGTYDPVTGTTTGATTATTTVKVTPPSSFDIKEVNGTSIQTGDVKVSTAAVDYVPDINQSVTFDNDTYNIISVSPLYSGHLIAKYDCQLRK